MHRLLSPGAQPEEFVNALGLQSAERAPAAELTGALTLSDPPMSIFRELQSTLREHGIQAEPADIARAVLEALAARPTLCRGLLAAYLLDA